MIRQPARGLSNGSLSSNGNAAGFHGAKFQRDLEATAYAANLLTKVPQPYILGAAESSPAYSHNITTAVRRGSDATMLLIVNGNDVDRTVSVDFAPYRMGGDVVRYRLSYSYLQSDLVADTTRETITLPRGGSVIYLFLSDG